MRKTRSLEQWRSIIEAQQSSDLTITEYCQQNALSKTTFYAAKNKLKALPGNFVCAKMTKQSDAIKPQTYVCEEPKLNNQHMISACNIRIYTKPLYEVFDIDYEFINVEGH